MTIAELLLGNGRPQCGKTRMVEHVLGLLSSMTGRYLVDGVRIPKGSVHRWRASLG